MKYLLIQVGPISKYPPALNVLQTLTDLNKDVVLITNALDENTASICRERGVVVEEILKDFPENISPVLKFRRMLDLRKKFWQVIDKYYDEDTILWVSSDAAIVHMGSELLKRRYILHMYELGENIIYYSKIPFLKINTAEYAHNALAVIQAEYNRAHIAQTWWELERTPFVLPNKPYRNAIPKKAYIQDDVARATMEKLQDKKIILYQGITSKERPLDKIILAVDRLGDDYAFVLMSGEENVYAHLDVSNYYFIPFVKPPYHLEVTSNAHIGVLSYFPAKNGYSKLNALFCAPNKIYEYAQFGIPMLGNDIPGLTTPFTKEGIGANFPDFEVDAVESAIRKIEADYAVFAENARKFYDKTDTTAIIKEITDFAEAKAFQHP